MNRDSLHRISNWKKINKKVLDFFHLLLFSEFFLCFVVFLGKEICPNQASRVIKLHVQDKSVSMDIYNIIHVYILFLSSFDKFKKNGFG